ncbi:hypothetical protein SY85_03580 [Flavisolibacter tropicus]|uniref:Uncharacterized protein n=1 Tax=Flavisolibacter tropicus TaxID=1492898 RepID=A0A172TSH3_9BACT|nr:hypothetical protein SY85_03580 [Flavisolibacter tropicus]
MAGKEQGNKEQGMMKAEGMELGGRGDAPFDRPWIKFMVTARDFTLAACTITIASKILHCVQYDKIKRLNYIRRDESVN